jgi:hypothetical protein
MDGPLMQIATLELEQPLRSDAQSLLADSYWSLAESNDFVADQSVLRQRALYWYRLALPQQPEGLRKVLIQERIRIAEEPLPTTSSRK